MTRPGGVCQACRGPVAGVGDLLCLSCWPKVPTPVKACYRLVWRLGHAGLVEQSVIGTLGAMVAREAREGTAVVRPPVAPTPTAPAAARPARPKRAGVERYLAVLPGSEQEALSVSMIAARCGVTTAAVTMALTKAVRLADPRVGARVVGNGVQRQTRVYWRTAA